MSEHIELTEPCGVLTVPGVREYVCRLEPVGEDTVNVTVCAPTEPIVRCRDCKYYDTAGPWCFEPSKVFIDEYGLDICPTVEPDGFCSWGERKVEQ